MPDDKKPTVNPTQIKPEPPKPQSINAQQNAAIAANTAVDVKQTADIAALEKKIKSVEADVDQLQLNDKQLASQFEQLKLFVEALPAVAAVDAHKAPAGSEVGDTSDDIPVEAGGEIEMVPLTFGQAVKVRAQPDPSPSARLDPVVYHLGFVAREAYIDPAMPDVVRYDIFTIPLRGNSYVQSTTIGTNPGQIVL